MHATKLSLCLAVLCVFACDKKKPGYARQYELLSIEDENAALTARLELVEARLAELESLSEQLAELRAVYRVQDGDAVIEGANLHIRSGQGRTRCFLQEDCNGKGNLIIGYNEPRRECVDSDENDGVPCSRDDQCDDGTCAPITEPYRTGSHNLIVGPRHSYTGHGNVALGASSTVSGGSLSVLGGARNYAEGYNNVVVGGYGNTVTESGSNTVVGGRENTAAGHTNVVVGGFENTTNSIAHSSVMLGHHGHDVTTDGDIAPDIQSVQRPWEDMEPSE